MVLFKLENVVHVHFKAFSSLNPSKRKPRFIDKLHNICEKCMRVFPPVASNGPSGLSLLYAELLLLSEITFGEALLILYLFSLC